MPDLFRLCWRSWEKLTRRAPTPSHEQESINCSAATCTTSFGPPGDEWTYTPNTRTYDLTRKSAHKVFKLEATRGPANISIAIDLNITALVIIDMQNYFLHPSCNTHPAGLEAARNTLSAIEKCREVGIKIIWLSWGLTDADLSGMPAATIHSFVGRFVEPPVCDGPAQDGFGFDLGDGKGRCLMNGSWNTQLYGPLAEECRPDADIICSKNRVSGLWNDTTPFSRALEKHKIKTLLFAGVNTDQCILGTLLDAYYRGMDCLMLQDCCATTTPGGQELPERGASRNYGFVVNSRSLRNGSFII